MYYLSWRKRTGRIAWSQRLIRVAPVLLLVDGAVDAADGTMESRASEDLYQTEQSLSTRTYSTSWGESDSSRGGQPNHFNNPILEPGLR